MAGSAGNTYSPPFPDDSVDSARAMRARLRRPSIAATRESGEAACQRRCWSSLTLVRLRELGGVTKAVRFYRGKSISTSSGQRTTCNLTSTGSAV